MALKITFAPIGPGQGLYTEREAAQIRRWRQSLGVTLAEWANLCGLSLGMLSKFERGRIMQAFTVARALNALRVVAEGRR